MLFSYFCHRARGHDRADKCFKLASADVLYPVDEIRRRASYTTLNPADQILTNFCCENSSSHCPVKTIHVETESFGITNEVLTIEAGIVLKQHVMHLPELVLFAGCLGDLGRG